MAPDEPDGTGDGAGSATVRPVVLVHGAWHGAWCFAALQSELDRRSIPSYAIDLPGHGTSELALGTLGDDTAHVRRAVRRIAWHHRRDVVLVGHSYGGAVVGNSVEAGLAIADLVYLAAFALDVGESVTDIVRAHREITPDGEPGPLGKAMIMRADGTSVLDPALAPAALYNTCSAEVIAAALPRLGPQPNATMTEAVTASPFDRALAVRIPTLYVRCTLDAAVPLVQQDAMAPRCDRTITLETDHSPFLSATEAVADLLEGLSRAPD